MYSYGALLLFCCIEEFVNNIVWWRCTIKEVEIKMLNTSSHKFLAVVLGLVETNDEWDSKLFENWNVVLRCKGSIFVGNIKWARKGDKFSRQNPIQVPVLYLFVVLVLLHIELFVVVPAQCNGVLKSHKTMLYRALVGAGAHSCITVRDKLCMVRCK